MRKEQSHRRRKTIHWLDAKQTQHWVSALMRVEGQSSISLLSIISLGKI
jgi:hypothetical protein